MALFSLPKFFRKQPQPATPTQLNQNNTPTEALPKPQENLPVESAETTSLDPKSPKYLKNTEIGA